MTDLRAIKLPLVSMISTAVLVGLPVHSISAALYQPTLYSDAFAGACGGSVSCVQEDQKTLVPATLADVESSIIGNTLTDGSYANANAISSFGSIQVYADAHRTENASLTPINGAIVGDAQSKGTGQFIDYFNPSATVDTAYNMTFNTNGAHTLQAGNGQYNAGVTAQSYLYFAVIDLYTQTDITSFNWVSSDAQPNLNKTLNFVVPAGHEFKVDVQFEASAYVMSNNDPNYLVAVSNYSSSGINGLKPAIAGAATPSTPSGLSVFLDTTTPGVTSVGVSGHDYSTAAAMPVPNAAWMFASGLLAMLRCTGKKRS